MSGKNHTFKGLGGVSKDQLQKLQAAFPARGNRAKQEKTRSGKPPNPQKANGPLVVPELDFSVPFMDENGVGLTPTPSFVRLAQLAAMASYNKRSLFVLGWPAQIYKPALLHGLASLAFYNTYGNRELRTLYWPATMNTGNEYKKVYVSAEWLRKCAVRIADKKYKERKDPRETPELSPKDWLFLMKMEQYQKQYGEIFPLEDSFHRYFWSKNNAWLRRPSEAFELIARAISKRDEKNDAREQAKKAANPYLAVDSLFCLHRDMTMQDMRRALESLVFDETAGGTQPNLAILDLRLSNWFLLESKWSKINFLIRNLQGKNETDLAGIIVFTDSPQILRMMRGKYSKLELFGALAPDLPMPEFKAVGSMEEADLQRGDTGQRNTQSSPPPAERFDVQLLGRPTAETAEKLLDLAADISAQYRNGAAALRKAAARLMDLAMFPTGIEEFETWLADRREHGGGYWDGSGWNPVYRELLELLDAGELGEDFERSRRILREADEHTRELVHSTPGAQALEEVLDMVTGDDPAWSCRRLLFITDTKPSRILCQEKIGELLGESDVEAMLSSELPKADIRADTGLVHLLTGQENIRYLFMLHPAPKWCRIVIGRGKAGRVFDRLGAVLEMEELRAYHPLAERIREQIEKNELTLPSEARLRYDDPFMAEIGPWGRETENSTPRGRVVVELSEHPAQQYSPGSTVYVFDRDSSWGYNRKAARDIQEDDLLLIPSDWMYAIIKKSIQRIDDELRKKSEEHVQTYQEMVRLYYQDKIVKGSMSKDEMVEKINREQKPSKPVTRGNLDYWLQGAHACEENDVRPHAPRDREQFVAFTKELGFPEDFSREVLCTGVRKARVSRQLEGRRLKREVLSYLSDHLDKISYGSIPREVIADLRREAARNSYRVLRVAKPEEPET